MMRNRYAVLALATFLSACKVGPDYQATLLDLPSVWGSDTQPPAPVAAQALPLNWWEQFKDPTLTALIAQGLKQNDDIALAAARLSEARAVLRLNEAYLYPTLSGQAGATRSSRSQEATFGGIGRLNNKPFNDFSLSAVLDYEISLWGKLQRASESARAALLAQEANRSAVQLAVASDIAMGYFNLLALDEQVAITNDTIKSRQAGYDYQQKQYKAGAIDILTFRRADAELAAAQAALPMLEQARVEQQQALSILLGRSPKEMIETPFHGGTKLAQLPVPPAMPLDAPSTLLERRPDIQAAEQQLIAANAQIGVAKADYYPTFSLSALLGLAGADIDRVLRTSARTWNAGVNSAVPILDFGKVSANVDSAEAQKEQARILYQQTVRRAFGDVANALSGVSTSAARLDAQARQVNANSETMRAAQLRYDAGYATQLDQLDAQRQLFQSQLDLLDAERARLAATVTLYKALGGGWDAKAPDATPAVAVPQTTAQATPKE